MARKAISEFRAKTLLYQALGIPYKGTQSFESITKDEYYVVKVDQGIKGRLKKGLVTLHVAKEDIPSTVKAIQGKGYNQILIEPEVPHEKDGEKYIAIERVRNGLQVQYSNKGGIDIEEHIRTIEKTIIKPNDNTSIRTISEGLRVDSNILKKLIIAFDQYYFAFLEINPFIVKDKKLYMLDAAVEVDATAQFFVNRAWTEEDFVQPIEVKTEEEKNVANLAERSQAAFSLTVLNPNGSIFMLLSGGGASIVLADEAKNLGYGHEVANYGEYSGNPNAEETYLYTKNILSLLLQSKAEKKALIVAGGVANFTDIRVTFRGVMKAFEEVKEELKAQRIQVFVRRGGPHQEEGLARMQAFLEKEELLGVVAGPDMTLTDIVRKAIAYIQR